VSASLVYLSVSQTWASADEDVERKTQAEVLLNAYSRELERRRLTAGAQGLLISGNGGSRRIYSFNLITLHPDDDRVDEDGDSSDEEFHYPGSSPTDPIRPDSVLSNRTNTTDYFSRAGGSRAPTDLTPHLSQAPEFRVPTHEAPQKVLTPRWTTPSPHQLHAQWERDDTVNDCRDCNRRFNFILRRVRSHTYFILAYIDVVMVPTAREFFYALFYTLLSFS
jgi:hypothetical protein